MPRFASIAAAALLSSAAFMSAEAHGHHMRHGHRDSSDSHDDMHHYHHHNHHHGHHPKAMEMAEAHAHALEEEYLADCAANTLPHGYYGAFLQPCTFTFVKSGATASGPGDACSAGDVVGQPVPMHWLFNQTSKMGSQEFWDKDNWRDVYDFGSSSSSSSSSSSDSFDFDKVDWDAFAQHLMLWPDQCVGAGPRCYSIHESGMDTDVITDALHRLFPDENSAPWTLQATHVQVNCQADAMELSRVIYSAAEVVESAVPAIVAVSVTIIVLSIVAGMWCCYAGVRLYKAWGDHGMTDKVRNGLTNGKAQFNKVVVVADAVDCNDVEMKEQPDTEYKRLIA